MRAFAQVKGVSGRQLSEMERMPWFAVNHGIRPGTPTGRCRRAGPVCRHGPRRGGATGGQPLVQALPFRLKLVGEEYPPLSVPW
ncbi:hypothetical protein GCM10027605_14930 [Micromonospora zhanjiangensis]